MKFVRFGGLSSVKQLGYNPKMPTGHCPPARRGIYAFVFPHIERFLLSSTEFKEHRMVWIKDAEGNKINDKHTDYATLLNQPDTICVKLKSKKPTTGFFRGIDDEWYLARHVKPRHFNYDGEIWHHLPAKPYEVIVRKGSWTKSSMQNYKNALEREVGKIESYKKRTGYGYMMDHFEVFIEKV